MEMRVAVIGGGAFGTAFSTLLVENGFIVNLWCHEEDTVTDIQTFRRNITYLPKIHLSNKIEATASLREAISGIEWIFIAVPIKYLRSILELASTHANKNHKWVILSKGIEQETLLLPTQVLDDVLGYEAIKFVLGGPSFAKEIAEQLHTAVTIAGTDAKLCKSLQGILSNSYFRPYLSDDPIGVQVCGALKNVFALMAGIVIGEGFGGNTKAFLLTMSFWEMRILVEFFGGDKKTIDGFSGFGDLILTCTGLLGRNLQVGKMIGSGQPIEEIEDSGITAEGVNTVQSIYKIINKHKLDLPICCGVYNIIFNRHGFREILDEIMLRPLRQEL